MSFSFDDKDIRKLVSDLGKFKKTALPDATKETLTRAAARAQLFAKQGISKKFIERNKFTQGSVKSTRAKGRIISRQEAAVGSLQDYMADQEFGATKMKTGKHGVDIPTSFSAGQGMKRQPRTRLPRGKHKLKNIRFRPSAKGKISSRRQSNIVKIFEAAKSGGAHVFLDFGKRKGIFFVKGSRKKPNIKMVHDLSSKAVRIPRRPWLRPAFDAAQRTLPKIFKGQLKFQLRKRGMFK